jgi:secreted trypsin-like serine protease
MSRPRLPLYPLAAAAVLLCATLVVLFLPALARAESALQAQSSIIRGDAAEIASFPSLAFIAAEDDEGQGFACTGTVIAPRVVLTAGHCVEELNFGGFTSPGDYLVVTGRTTPRQAGSGEVLGVGATHVFPGFDPGTTRGDAALLVLAGPTTAPPLPLATAADAALYQGGAPVQLAGWGLTRPDARAGAESLRTTGNVVLDPAACKQRTRPFYPPYSVAQQMCTTDPPDRANGGCFGDSGGPAIALRPDGTPVQLGIVSSGGPRCSTKLPNVFTRADRVSAWASEWVAAVELGAPPPTLKPRLPAMSRESAQQLIVGLLNARLGKLFTGSRDVSGSCRRLGKAKFKCELIWTYGPKIYLGTVTARYVVQQNAVAWDSSYLLRRASIRCLRGEHPGRCPVETRRG